MDDLRVGAAFRAVRRHRGWRQIDVAGQAGLDQATVSRIERGHLDAVSIDSLRRIGRALEIQVPMAPRWRGGELARLLDEAHAALVEEAAKRLARSPGWTLVPELTYSRFGERGSLDLVAWHADQRALVLVEVKTALLDLQDLLAQRDRRLRIVPGELRRERGWSARSIGYVLVLPESSAMRAAVRRHQLTFEAALPGRAGEIRAWVANPTAPLSALWFLTLMRQAHGKQRPIGRIRVRSPHGSTR